MKVLLHALGPWSSATGGATTPGWIGVVAVLSAASMTYGNFAALAQKNFKRLLAYSSIAHAGYLLVGVAAAGVSVKREESAGSVLFYLVAYSFANIGAFALAAWMARDKGSEQIDDLNGMAYRYPGMATCTLLLMLSLIGMPPLAGFMGKLYMFMEALDEGREHVSRLTLLWLVALGLFNSVVSAFYYVRVLKAMFLRPESGTPLAPPPTSVMASIVLATAVSLLLGVMPGPVINWMKGAAVPMLSPSGSIGQFGPRRAETQSSPPAPPQVKGSRSDLRIDGGPGAAPRPVTPPQSPTLPTPSKEQRLVPGAEPKK
jgi:NADH-quinone oxidoreductase subunit N